MVKNLTAPGQGDKRIVMTEGEVLALLKEVGALITGSHIVYTSGRHGGEYINKDAVYPHTEKISMLCRALAERYVPQAPEVVVAPALGGIILSQWIAHHLTALSGKEVLGVYAEKGEQGFLLKRGYDQPVSGKRVLIAEDILTTGGSVRQVVELVQKNGGKVVGVAALCNRGGVTAAELGGVPRIEVLVRLSLESWEESECPLCRQKVPVNTAVGKGLEFLKKKR